MMPAIMVYAYMSPEQGTSVIVAFFAGAVLITLVILATAAIVSMFRRR